MKTLEEIVESPELLEVGRRSIEDTLVDFRNNRISILGRGNGLVIREYDGKSSDIIRLGTKEALRIGLQAIIKHLKEEESNGKGN